MVRQACFAQTLQFYEQGLGLKIRHKSEEWAEFHAHDFPIILKAVQNESECSTGYSPMICLEVDDMDMVIQSCWTAFITFDGAGLERDNYWVTLSVKKATSWRNVRSKRGISIASVLPLGASLDGAIQYPVHGKIASIRTPDGHMVGLFEAAL